MAGFIRDELWASHGRRNHVERPDNFSREHSHRRHSWNRKSWHLAPAGRPRDRKQRSYGETSHHDHRRKRCLFYCPPRDWTLPDSSRTFWLYAVHHRSSPEPATPPRKWRTSPCRVARTTSHLPGKPCCLPPVSTSSVSLQPAISTIGASSGAQIPSFPGDPNFSGDSFIVDGQASIVNPFFQMDDLMRQSFEDGHQLQGNFGRIGRGPQRRGTGHSQQHQSNPWPGFLERRQFRAECGPLLIGGAAHS